MFAVSIDDLYVNKYLKVTKENLEVPYKFVEIAIV